MSPSVLTQDRRKALGILVGQTGDSRLEGAVRMASALLETLLSIDARLEELTDRLGEPAVSAIPDIGPNAKPVKEPARARG